MPSAVKLSSEAIDVTVCVLIVAPATRQADSSQYWSTTVGAFASSEPMKIVACVEPAAAPKPSLTSWLEEPAGRHPDRSSTPPASSVPGSNCRPVEVGTVVDPAAQPPPC